MSTQAKSTPAEGGGDRVRPAPAPKDADAAPGPAAPSLAARLSRACVGTRADLEVSRHVFRGEVAYVVRDPVTLGHHRMGRVEYGIFVHLREDVTLGSIFTELCTRGILRTEDEEEYYHFVFSMHRLGFLSLPLDDGKMLYQRAQRKNSARLRGWATAFLSLQVPLWNPDRFLGRTLRYARPFFTPAATALWFLTVLTAGWVVARQWEEFTAPLHDVFANDNLPLLWASLVLLKLAHEFGHAYACKFFGGHVPQMGLTLILFTPTAWVDASSSWTFPNRWRRLFVALAGMYVELFLAALGVFVWSVTAPGLVRSIAHDVVLLASVVTIAFNLNPLLRYDGYHALCDLTEVPNLRARATAYTLALAKRVLLGLPIGAAPSERGLRVLFVGFALACAVARVLVAVGLCAAISSKFYALGVLLGVGYLGFELVRILAKVGPWLWRDPETAAVRARAVSLSIFLFALLPIALAALPMPARALFGGVLAPRDEAVVCTTIEAEVAELFVEPGAQVRSGEPIARLDVHGAELRVEAARARRLRRAARPRGLGRGAELRGRAGAAPRPRARGARRSGAPGRRADRARAVRRRRPHGALAHGDGELPRTRSRDRAHRRGAPVGPRALYARELRERAPAPRRGGRVPAREQSRAPPERHDRARRRVRRARARPLRSCRSHSLRAAASPSTRARAKRAAPTSSSSSRSTIPRANCRPPSARAAQVPCGSRHPCSGSGASSCDARSSSCNGSARAVDAPRRRLDRGVRSR
ncbi:MAG: hypothetical protein IPJ77_16565 [Planctomycetes bacterium]|nr:hypothetical protein [Planctomycetota bacterium]